MGRDGRSEPPKTIQDYWTDVCVCFCWKSNKNGVPNINACFTACVVKGYSSSFCENNMLGDSTISSWQIHPAGSASIRQHDSGTIFEHRWKSLELCWLTNVNVLNIGVMQLLYPLVNWYTKLLNMAQSIYSEFSTVFPATKWWILP